MKAFILYITILNLHHNVVSGQTGIVTNRLNLIDTTKRPLVIIDCFQTDLEYLVFDPNKIESIDVFKDSTTTAMYGQAGKYGVIIIRPKENASFLQVDKILDKYNIATQDRALRICINKTLVKEPRLILIEKSELLNVEITTDRHWVNVEDANSGEKFINIITQTSAKDGL